MNNTLKKITAVIILITLSAFSLCLVACGGDSLSSELQEAKDKIESDKGEEICEGWTYLVEHKDEEQAAKLIDSLGGIPTPTTNISQLYRMTSWFPGFSVVYSMATDENKRIGAYFRTLKNAGLLSEVNTQKNYDMTFTLPTELVLSAGSNNINLSSGKFYASSYQREEFARYEDDAEPNTPFFELEYRDITLAEDITEEDVSALFEDYVDLVGLEDIQDIGSTQWDFGNPKEGSQAHGNTWVAYGGESCPYYLILFKKSANDGSISISFTTYLSSYFDSGSFESFTTSPTYLVGVFNVLRGLFTGDVFSEGKETPKRDTSKTTPPSSSPSSSNDTSSDIGNNGEPKDRLITETDGKYVYRVYAAESSIHITGSYTGSGHFSIEVLNSNQKLHDLAANEIGDHKVDTRVSVRKGEMYYIQIEWTSGTWNLQWTGTGGD